MSIRINKDKCVRCMKCRDVCPGSLIAADKDGAYIKYPKDCWGCASCLKECKAGAIEFFLAEDIGGGDAYMQVKENKEFLLWDFYNKNGLVRTISVDRTSSNKY